MERLKFKLSKFDTNNIIMLNAVYNDYLELNDSDKALLAERFEKGQTDVSFESFEIFVNYFDSVIREHYISTCGKISFPYIKDRLFTYKSVFIQAEPIDIKLYNDLLNEASCQSLERIGIIKSNGLYCSLTPNI